MIEIGLCCDENYAMPTGVCVTSIFESNKANKIRVHILTNGFTDDTVRRFEETAKKYGQQIEIYNIDDAPLKGLHVTKHFVPICYGRLLLPQVLSCGIEKLLYIDSDVVVVGDLSELYATEFGDKACMAVVDAAGSVWNQKKMIENNHSYVNAGVLLMNLPKWRENNWGEKCIEYASKYPEKCEFPDQDAINDVVGKQIGFIHPKYNFFSRFFFVFSDNIYSDKDKLAIFKEARKAPVIIHYTWIKPWHREYLHRSKKYFIKALKSSLWSDYKIKSKKYNGVKFLVYCLRERLRDIRKVIFKRRNLKIK